MKKMGVVLIGLMITAVLSACGAKDDKGIPEEISSFEKTETKTESAVEEATETVETKEEPSRGSLDTVDVVVGSDVLPVNEFETKYREFRLSALPELHIMLPSSDITCAIEDGDTMHDRQYSVETTEGNGFYVRIYLDGKNDEYCPAKHEEWIDYGRYAVDYNWCQFAVKDYETETVIVVLFLMGDKERTDKSKQLMEDCVRINIEYVKEQVASWDQDYVPVESQSIDSEETNANEVNAVSYIQDENYAVLAFDKNLVEDTNLYGIDIYGYEYTFELVKTSDTSFDGMVDGEIAVTITIDGDTLFLDTEYENYCNLYGAYTLDSE